MADDRPMAPPGSTTTLATSGPPTNPVNAGAGVSDYRIGPRDILSVDVFQVPDLSRVVQVDGFGFIAFPLIGQVAAAGRSTAELSNDISTALAAHYVKDPLVSVTMKESQSQRVTIDGAVEQPGIYPLTGPTTLLQAVALARGADPRVADLHKVSISRTLAGRRVITWFDLSAIRSGRRDDPQVLANDTIVVGTSTTRSFLRDLAPLLPLASIIPVL
jgi:polysaccharide export outer membrane protein